MQITVRSGAAQRIAADALVLGILEGTSKLTGAAAAVDTATGRLVREVLKRGDFSGKSGQSVVL